MVGRTVSRKNERMILQKGDIESRFIEKIVEFIRFEEEFIVMRNYITLKSYNQVGVS